MRKVLISVFAVVSLPVVYLMATIPSARATATTDNSAVSVGAGIRYICQTSAPAPVGRARTWVRCSDGHQMFTDATNTDHDLQTGGAAATVSCLTAAGAAGTGCSVVGAATRVRGPGGLTDAYSPALGANYKLLRGVPFPVPSDVTQVRVRVSNSLWNTSSVNSGSATLNVGVCPSNGSYQCSGGAFTGSTTGLTIPGPDIDVVAPTTSTWFTVSRGTDKNIMVIFGFDTGANASFSEAYGSFSIFGKYLTGTATLSASPTWTATDTTPELQVNVEYDTSHKRIVVQGDSIAKGNSSSTPPGWENAWPQIFARDKDYGVTTLGIAGATYATHMNFSGGANIRTQPVFTGADCILALGTNDFASGVDTLKIGAPQLVAWDRSAGCVNVYILTVPPCNVAGNTTDRTYWNTFLLSSDVPPFGATKIIDVDTALDPTHTNLLSTTACGGGTCDSGDGCHPSAAGQTKIAQTVEAAIP